MAARLDYRNFHEVFGHGEAFPYDQHVIRDIESKRKTLGGVLFIDRVLTALGISKGKVYPPRDPRGLHDLFQHILAAPMSSHHKDSALYYLLLDHDDVRGTRSRAAAAQFAVNSGLPRRYQIFMTGLWHLDRLQSRAAVEHLAHPSLLPEFGDDIVRVLAKEGQKTNNDYSLVLAYYHAVRPVLRTPGAVALLFEALARTDAAGALAYARAQPAAARQQLFEKLVEVVLETPSTASTALVYLPLHADEEAWLRAYLTTGAGRALAHARDTLLMRQIVTGDVHVGGAAVGGNANNLPGPWAIVLQGLRPGGGVAQ